MRNVTISMEESLAHWSRIAAAEHDMSLSAFIAHLLRERMRVDADYEQAMQRALSRKARPLGWRKQVPDREAIHERSGLRR